MGLKLVWRNPVPPVETESNVQRIMLDQFGAVYVVTRADVMEIHQNCRGYVRGGGEHRATGQVVYGGETAGFSSLRALRGASGISSLNLFG